MTTEADNTPVYWRDDAALEKMIETMTTGDLLACWRDAADWTLEAVASQLDMSPQMFHAYETNKRLPSLDKAMRIAALFNKSHLQILRFILRDQLRKAGIADIAVSLNHMSNG